MRSALALLPPRLQNLMRESIVAIVSRFKPKVRRDATLGQRSIYSAQEGKGTDRYRHLALLLGVCKGLQIASISIEHIHIRVSNHILWVKCLARILASRVQPHV